MVVVSLTVILMLGASALFMTFLIGNTQISTQQLIKAEGSYAQEKIEFLLRNATELVPNPASVTCTDPANPSCVCTTGMSSISFKSRDGGVTTLAAQADASDENKLKIASNSGIFLTSSSVELLGNLTINCTQPSNGSPAYVELGFELRKGTPGIDQARDIVSQEFTTGVSLRSR